MTNDLPHAPKIKSRKGQWFFVIGLAAAVFFGLKLLGNSQPGSSGGNNNNSYTAIDVIMGGAWIRQPPPGIEMTAGYLKITNPGDSPLRLISVESEAFNSSSIHKTQVVDGKSQMRHIDKLDIPPGNSVQFEPGGLHIMLMGPKKSLVVGESLPLTLTFENGKGEQDSLTSSFRVKGL